MSLTGGGLYIFWGGAKNTHKMRGALIVVITVGKNDPMQKKIVEALRGRAATANIQFMTFPDRNTTIGKRC
jgi:hypothetical protein